MVWTPVYMLLQTKLRRGGPWLHYYLIIMLARQENLSSNNGKYPQFYGTVIILIILYILAS